RGMPSRNCTPGAGAFARPTIPDKSKKGAGENRPEERWGIEPYATRARSVQTPGGWGAEESGARTRPGPNQLMRFSHFTAARRGPKSGFIVEPLNETVSEGMRCEKIAAGQ